ncbi:MAG: cyanophycinase [Saprospiraceae bacterium]|nr:cyanophycinase [Saprospiraceae bacterium]
MKAPKGTLIPIGGNEDKGIEVSEQYSLEFISEGILYHVVKESGGPDGLFVVIPTASSIPKEVGDNYLSAFHKLGCDNVVILDIRHKEEADLPENLKLVQEANCVMFSGGDQSKITDRVEGTLMHDLLANRYLNDSNFVIAGTSAGAMAMSKKMIAGGSSAESFIKGAVRMYHGLGFLPNVMFDTHFIMRGRFGRVSEAVAINPELLGIGLAEDTGMIIKNGNEMKVIGSGMVIIFDGHHITHNNHELLEESTPLTLTDLRVHVLSNSDKFYLKERRVEVLGIHEPFV